MAIDFPDSPVINDIFTVGTKSWIYDGEKWKAYGETVNEQIALTRDRFILFLMEVI